MPMLVIAGTSYEVLTTGASEGKPERSGGPHITYSGRRRSTVKYELRNWTFPLAPLTEAAYQVLYNATRHAAQVACSGDALPYALTAEIEIESADYIPDVSVAIGFKRLVSVRVLQVTAAA